jgi:repressor of nif and glnA expression
MALKFIHSKIEELMYGVTFDPKSFTGKIAFNTSIIKEEDLDEALTIFKTVYASGLNVGPYLKVIENGENFNGVSPDKGYYGILTVCSITIDGVLLKAGIPVSPTCGGVIQVHDNKPIRFTEILRYDATTMDPLDVFMSQEMTSVLEMIKTGSGKILGNVREAPMIAKDHIESLIMDLMDAEFRGVLEVGEPNADILEVPVTRGHIGIAIIGGIDPMAAVKERGIDINVEAISGLADIRDMTKID